MAAQTTCSMDSKKLRAFAEECMLPHEEKDLLLHLLECKECQKELREIYESLIQCEHPSLTEGEKYNLREIALKHAARLAKERSWRQAGWTRLESIAAALPQALAAADDQTADQKLLKSVLAARTMAFVSICDKDHPDYWRAEFPLPSVHSPEVELSLKITDGAGRPIQNGKFIFCDIEIPVVKGRCYITLSEFRDRLKKQSVAFRSASGEVMEGLLEFIPEEGME